jgi:phosphoglucomutase
LRITEGTILLKHGQATVFLACAIKWEQNGISPAEKLDQLFEKYGYYKSKNSYFVTPTPSLTKTIFDNIRDSRSEGQDKEIPYPEKVANIKITRWRDLTLGFDSAMKDKLPTLPVDPLTQMITCWLEDGSKFTIRGSGTEPKIKCTYFGPTVTILLDSIFFVLLSVWMMADDV